MSNITKALSIIEPYATLIRDGHKLIETRSWKTSYCGELYIHACSRRVPKEWKANKRLMSLAPQLHFGQVVCKCELVDCVLMTQEFIDSMDKNGTEYLSGFYEVGRYAWILKNVEVIDSPQKVRGNRRIWNLDLNSLVM